ncbi:unnamed protein product, partial [Brassica rapa]
MANSFTLLADLKAGHAPHRRECKHISFRLTLGGFFHSDCLKFWVSPFQQLTLMQGSVSSKYHFRFRNRLTEGSVYSLSGFDVTRRNPNFRLSDAPSPYDMIGELNAIRSTITDRIPGAQCVILTLRLQSGDNVCVSMFDSMALAFHSKLESCGKESKIVLATSVNPKIVGDNVLDFFSQFWSLFMVFSSKCIREMHAIHCLFWTEVLLTKPIYVLAGGLFLNATYATHL